MWMCTHTLPVDQSIGLSAVRLLDHTCGLTQLTKVTKVSESGCEPSTSLMLVQLKLCLTPCVKTNKQKQKKLQARMEGLIFHT